MKEGSVYFPESDKQSYPKRRYFGMHIDPVFEPYVHSIMKPGVEAYYFSSAYQRPLKEHNHPNGIVLDLKMLHRIHEKGATIFIMEHRQCGFDTLMYYPLQKFLQTHPRCFYFKGCCDSPLLQVSDRGKRLAITKKGEPFQIKKEPFKKQPPALLYQYVTKRAPKMYQQFTLLAQNASLPRIRSSL